MSTRVRRKRRRPDMRRAVILFPSGLTLGNLFFGVFAIIAASRLEFVAAGVYVLLGGICDALDGRVARATNAGTEFGEELDSLVDAITFGLAPGMIMYFAVLNRSGWDWVFVFVFAACAVLRLARFNIEQAGTAKTYFQGLPSPAAGITLASYYWFSQSSLYTYGAIADLKWHVLLRYLMAFLSFLMISNVPYPVFPRTGLRSIRSIGATLLLIGSVALLVSRRLEFFFPFALVYVAWGLLRWVFSGLFERRQPTIPYDLSEGEDDEEDEEDEEFELTDSRVHATRRSHRERTARTEHLEPAERSGRGEREERGDRHRARAERTSQREQVAERSAERASERKERPERAERASGKEGRTRDGERSRREGRQKERTPRERPPREPRPETANAPALEAGTASGVDAITLGAPSEDAVTAATVASLHEPLAPAAPSGETAEATPAPRKRKRRRRRGDRKDRAIGGDGTQTASDTGAGGDEDAGDDGGDESPYVRSEPTSPSTAIVPTTVTVAPPPPAEAPRPAAETPPLLPPPPSDSSE